MMQEQLPLPATKEEKPKKPRVKEGRMEDLLVDILKESDVKVIEFQRGGSA